MENYVQIKVLGKGSFGAAWLVQRKMDNASFVAKEVRLGGLKPAERESAKHEISMLRNINHPNITRYVDHFEHRGSLFIVMEYANGGDLYTKIQSRRKNRFTEKDILHYFTQICLALLYLHEKHILHRDLKSQNIFLTADGIVKLGDFGISTVLRSTYELKRTVCGTPYYFSPELCLSKPYNNKSDVWALGCILYELTTLNHAFDGTSMKALVQKILRGAYPPIPSNYSADLKQLVASMLQIDPAARPSVQQMIAMPFIRDFLGGLRQEVHGAKAEGRSCVDPQEQRRAQLEAQRRMEEEKVRAAQQAVKDKETGAALAYAKLRRAEQLRAQMEQQQRADEVRMRAAREQQAALEARKREMEAKVRAQRRQLAEKHREQDRVAKEREALWEDNMKESREANRRDGGYQDHHEGGYRPPPLEKVQRYPLRARDRLRGPTQEPPAVPAPTPRVIDAMEAYRRLRMEAAANKRRVQELERTPPVSRHGEQRDRGGDHPARAPPAPGQRKSPMEDANSRKNAFMQMRQEAAENKRRLMALANQPSAESEPGPGPSPPLPAPTVPKPVALPLPPAPLPPGDPAAAAKAALGSPSIPLQPPATAEEDETEGMRRFLNGEAAAGLDGGNAEKAEVAKKRREGEYGALEAAIDQAMLSVSQQQGEKGVLEPAKAANHTDFSDPALDPAKFILDGKTLELPRCSSNDPLMYRIEFLRLFLESSMGTDTFIATYRKLNNLSSDDDATMQEVLGMLPDTQHRYIPVIVQLIVCEEYFHHQGEASLR